MQTFSVLGLRPVCLALATMERDPAPILKDAGIAPEMIADPDARVPVATAFAVFEAAAKATGNSAFGLRAAELVPPGALEVVDVAARSAPTAGAAIERLARYYALVDDGAVLQIERAEDVIRLIHDSVRSDLPPLAAIELLFGLIVTRGREITQTPLPVRAVRLRHPVPENREAHDGFFGVPIVFDWPRHEIEIDAAWFEAPCTSADPVVSSLVERFLRTATAGLPASEDVVDQVRRAIAESLASGDPSLEVVAQRMAMSTRTLQRKLQAEKRSFADMVDDVRRQIALAQLAEPRLSISEVGYMLGFSEPSAFHRAFRRWTNLSPSEWRKARAVK